jgi:DNA repair protein RadA/Sms
VAKTKTVYICQSCGTQSPKWAGRCSSCGEWNTFVEEVVSKTPENAKPSKNLYGEDVSMPQLINDVEVQQSFRIITKDAELNRVLGGGIVPGSLVLIGGEPGIGKSTLMLQLALSFENVKVLYVSGEESAQQISMRAKRVGSKNSACYIIAETATDRLLNQLKELRPSVVIIDSIQTLQTPLLESTPGSISQIRECAAELQRYAKETSTPVFLIGHITKDGNIAGPKVLEHIVDTVLQFEGDRNYNYRILRTSKNRFGSTSELGIYEMQQTGLREVSNPSELLLSNREELLSGIAIGATVEGLRPMLIETQALVSQAVYGTPQRSCTGFDVRRLHMLLAVLDKRLGFHFGAKDVFLNIAGGIKVEDPAIDLAVVSALLSSYEDSVVPANYCFAGEVGLSGEIRTVNRIEQRISEADKLGFEKIFVASFSVKGLSLAKYKIEVVKVNKVQEVFQKLF